MNTYNTNKYKHLTKDARFTLERLLTTKSVKLLNDVALILGKTPSAISKEVKKRRVFKSGRMHNHYGMSNTRCEYFNTCEKNNVCKDYKEYYCKTETCKSCSSCYIYCRDFKQKVCPVLKKWPYVCNGCNKASSCRYDKFYYKSEIAHKDYNTTLVESREGVNIDEVKLKEVDLIVSTLLRDQKQPLYHIYNTHETDIPFSLRTLYNYFENNLLSAKNIDLPRKVKYKIRKTSENGKLTKAQRMKCREGRTHSDYNTFISNNPGTSIVQMDVVEGKQTDEKVLLTFTFLDSHFLAAFLLDRKTSENVESVFNDMFFTAGVSIFKELFGCILTDNGPEFRRPEILEYLKETGEFRTRMFYCDPYSSYQKGAIENIHRYIRYIIPKGHSLDWLTQYDINLIISHINSTMRPSTGKSTPYSIMCQNYCDDFIEELFGVTYVSANDVTLSPSLIKK